MSPRPHPTGDRLHRHSPRALLLLLLLLLAKRDGANPDCRCKQKTQTRRSRRGSRAMTFTKGVGGARHAGPRWRAAIAVCHRRIARAVAVDIMASGARTVGIEVHCVSVHLAVPIYKLASPAVGPRVDTTAVPGIVDIGALVSAAVGPRVDPMAVPFVVHISTHIALTVGPRVDPMAVAFVFHKVALVPIAIGPCVGAPAVCLVGHIIALMPTTTGTHTSAVAVVFTIVKAALVVVGGRGDRCSRRSDKKTVSVRHPVGEVTLVERGRIALCHRGRNFADGRAGDAAIARASAVEPLPVFAAAGKVSVERRSKARLVQTPPQ